MGLKDMMVPLLTADVRTVVHNAAASVSPVRIRMIWSMFETKIFPSPISPAPAASTDRGNDPVDKRSGNRNFDLHLWNEVNGVLGATINFGMPLLLAEPLDLGDGHSGDPHPRQRVPHFVEFERLNNCDDEFQGIAPRGQFG